MWWSFGNITLNKIKEHITPFGLSPVATLQFLVFFISMFCVKSKTLLTIANKTFSPLGGNSELFWRWLLLQLPEGKKTALSWTQLKVFCMIFPHNIWCLVRYQERIDNLLFKLKPKRLHSVKAVIFLDPFVFLLGLYKVVSYWWPPKPF